jgi:hypothetical protein
LRTVGGVEMVGASEVPIVGAVDVPIVGSREVPIVGAVGVPIVGSVEAPIVGCSDVPIVGRVGVPIVDLVGVPIVGIVEVPIVGNVAVPIVARGGVPSAGNASDGTSGNNVPAGDVAFVAPGVSVEFRFVAPGARFVGVLILGSVDALVPVAGEGVCARTCGATAATASADAVIQLCARMLIARLLVAFASSGPAILGL